MNSMPGSPATEVEIVDRQAKIEQQLQLLKVRDPRQRCEAVKRLGVLQAAPEIILPLLGDPNPYLREASARALGDFNQASLGELYAETCAHLRGALNDPNDHVVEAAIRSLGILRVNAALPEIRQALAEANPYVVRTALIALGRLGDHESAERISALLDSSKPVICLAAWRSLALLNYPPLIPRLLNNLQAALETPASSHANMELLQAYLETCATLQVKAAAPLLIQIAQKELGLRTRAVQALLALELETFPAELAGLLGDPNPNLRTALLRLVQQTHYALTPAQLHRLLHDEVAQIRQETLELLWPTQDPAAFSLIRFLCYRDSSLVVRVKALACLVKLDRVRALSDLHALAFDSEVAVRCAVAQNLGTLGSPLSDKVIAILKHLGQDEAVRPIAAAVLQTLALGGTPTAPLAPPVLWLPFPEQWAVSPANLLTACAQWQTVLARAKFAPEQIEEVTALQTALATLITALRMVETPAAPSSPIGK